MQGGGRDTISTRLALSGGDEIKKELAEIGAAGEKAFTDIEKTVELSNSRLSGLSNFVSSMRSSFTATATAFKPFTDQLGNVREHFNSLGESVSVFAEKTFPHFREVLSIGAAAGLAGFVAFIASGAKVADQLQRSSRALGISVEDFQKLQIVAVQSGIGIEQFGTAMFRFAGNLHKAQEDQLQKTVDITSTLYGKLKINGTEVIRGTAQAAEDASDMVVRGNRKVSESITDVSGELAKTPAETQKVMTQLRLFAENQRTLIIQAGGTINKTADQMAQDLARAASRGDEAAVKLRKDLRDVGIDVLPKTIGEALDRTQQTFAQKLSGLIQVWETTTDEFGKTKLVPINVEEGFRRLADRVKGFGDATRAASIVRENFGRDMQNMAPLLMKGSEGIGDLATEFTKLHLSIKATDTVIGEELSSSIEVLENDIRNLKAIIAVAFAPTLLPFVKALSQGIASNADHIREMAKSIADELEPGLKDIEELLKGMPKSEIKTEWVRLAIGAFDGLAFTVRTLISGFKILAEILDHVADGFNAIFGTHITGSGILIAAMLLRITSGFNVLWQTVLLGKSVWLAFWMFPYAATGLAISRAFTLISNGLSLIRTGMLATAGVISWPILLIAALVAAGVALYVYRDQVKDALKAILDYFTPAWEGWKAGFNALYRAVSDGINWVTNQFNSAVTGWSELFKWIWNEIKGGWDWLLNGIDAGIKKITGWFNDLIAFAKRVADAISSVPGFGGSAPGTPMASGGPVIGPGGRDRVPISATAGEWVHTVAAVQKYGMGFMRAVNSLTFPESLARAFNGFRVAPEPPTLAFAGGGMVPALAPAGGGLAGKMQVDLVAGNRRFPMIADEAVAGSLARFARGDQMRRMGDLPDWHSGGRGR